MKALPVEKLPEGDWLYEIKHDGYRALAFKDGKNVRLVSRMTRETSGTPKEFDRYIRGFFVGLLGVLFLAACVCAILFQKHTDPKTDLADRTSLAKSESSPTAEVVTPLTKTGLSKNGSSDV